MKPATAFSKIQRTDKTAAGGDSIGRILVIEFNDQDTAAFDEVMSNENNAVGCHIRNLWEKLYEASPLFL